MVDFVRHATFFSKRNNEKSASKDTECVEEGAFLESLSAMFSPNWREHRKIAINRTYFWGKHLEKVSRFRLESAPLVTMCIFRECAELIGFPSC